MTIFKTEPNVSPTRGEGKSNRRAKTTTRPRISGHPLCAERGDALRQQAQDQHQHHAGGNKEAYAIIENEASG
jgi:hypothetical protein